MKILILGGASGFGKEFVREYYNDGHTIVAVDKNQSNLQVLKQEYPDIEIFCVDLTSNDNLRLVFETYKDVDMVVNSAGIGYLGNFSEVSYEREIQ